MKRSLFEAQYGKLASNITYIDLDAQPREVVTCGWPDSRIRDRPVEFFDGIIAKHTAQAESLRGTIRDQEDRAAGVRTLRRRCIALTGDIKPNPAQVTAGWTDEQIMNKTPEQLAAEVNSAQRLCDSLRATLRKLDAEAADFDAIRRRRLTFSN